MVTAATLQPPVRDVALPRLSQLENGSGYFHDFTEGKALILRDRVAQRHVLYLGELNDSQREG